MKHRYWLYLREGGCYYFQDAETGKRTSLRAIVETKDLALMLKNTMAVIPRSARTDAGDWCLKDFMQENEIPWVADPVLIATFKVITAFTQAGYRVRKLSKVPWHPVWELRFVRVSAPVIRDAKKLKKHIGAILRDVGVTLSSDCFPTVSRTRLSLGFIWEIPGGNPAPDTNFACTLPADNTGKPGDKRTNSFWTQRLREAA
jgi:hypothetical protein